MTTPLQHVTAPVPRVAIPHSDRPRRTWLGTVSRTCAALAALGGVAVLAGWAFGIPELRSLGFASSAVVNPLSALLFVAAAASLWLFSRALRTRHRHIARGLALAVLVLGILRLVGEFSGLAVGVDTVLFHDALGLTRSAVVEGHPSRMAPNAALNFVLLGAALLLLRRRERTREAMSQVMATVVLVFAQAALLGNLYQSGWFLTIGQLNRMAPPSTIAFSLLAMGTLLLRPRSGVIAVIFSEGPGGTLARGLLPAGFLAPTVFGYLAIVAMRADNGSGSPITPELVVTLFVFTMILVFVGLIAWNATLVHESHVERARAEEALRDSEIRFRLLAENGSDVVSLHDLSGRVSYVSPSCERVLGFAADEIMRMSPFALVHPDDSERLRRHFDALIRGQPVTAILCRMLNKSGKHLWLEMMWRAVTNREGRVVRLQVSSRDVTERTEYQRQLEEARRKLQVQQEHMREANMRLETLAALDSLTGLRNRRALEERLHEELARAKRNVHPLSLLLLDIDHFKAFNDSFGHPRGDEVLRNVARLLTSSIRDADFAARYGGEEFAIVLPDTDREGAQQMGERLREAIEQATWEERSITISVGAATVGPDASTLDELVEHADRALYRSKEQGRNRVTVAA